MTKFDINIVMLTYRSDFIAKANLKIALETIANYKNARLIVGYGGQDEKHYRWLENLRSYLDEKSSFELIYEISATDRLKWALQFPSEWLIFITDDDIISSNYLSVFIKEIGTVDASVSNIFPKHYGLNSGLDVEYIKLNEVLDLEPFDRAKSYIASPNSGVRYYSAHRVSSINKIIFENFKLNFFPSYLDQLITLSSVINGKSIACGESNILIYNLENWIDVKACIKSDAKLYKIDKMVFFHEVLWTCDYVNLLFPYCGLDRNFNWIKLYCLRRLNDALNTFISRLDLIKINTSQARSILNEINHLIISISNYEDAIKIKDELNQCKLKILNEVTNKIYFGATS